MIVLKFGGTSVSAKDRIQTIYNVVQRERSNDPIVVVSAIRGVTDMLLSLVDSKRGERQEILEQIESIHIDLANSIWDSGIPNNVRCYIHQCMRYLGHLSLKKGDEKLLDEVVSFGEMLSSYIIAAALKEWGVETKQILATSCIITDEHFGSAEFIPALTKNATRKILTPLVKNKIVPVVTGFIGSTIDGRITTLGRGGSDYTAAILGFVLHASEIQIWTDVNGIYTSDPRTVNTAMLIPVVTYKEASELATFGARVLHPRTIRPAISANIPVRVMNTLCPENNGTMVRDSQKKLQRVTAVACKRNVTLVNLYSTDMLLSKGFLQRVFTIFAEHNISIDLVSVSEVSISVTLDNDENLSQVVKKLEKFASVSVIREFGIVSIVGENIVHVPHVMKHIFGVLDYEHIPVKMISLGATDINISLVIPSKKISMAVQLIHDTLLPAENQEWRYL